MKRTNSLKFGGITLKAHKTAGFTLAEVLITLGIIGVVAAMTIPNLIANTNGAKYRSGFKKALSTLSQAGLMAQAQYDFDYAGITSANVSASTCASHHPETDMTMCAILNGTLTGQTFRGKASDIKRQSNSSAGSSASTYNFARTHSIWNTSSYLAYSLADGSIIGFSPEMTASRCTKANAYDGNPQSLSLSCSGFIDVNGVTLPNKEIQCTNTATASADASGACYVSNNANDMTDVFPIVFHDGIVEPRSDAAKYVLSTAK